MISPWGFQLSRDECFRGASATAYIQVKSNAGLPDHTAECTRNGNYGVLPKPTEIQILGVETNNMCVNEFPRFDINVIVSITDLNYSDDVFLTFLTVGGKHTQQKLPLKKWVFSVSHSLRIQSIMTRKVWRQEPKAASQTVFAIGRQR